MFVLEKWRPSQFESNFLNVGTGTDLTIRELANIVAKASDYDGEIYWDTSKPDGTPKKQLDVSKLSKLGWRASISLEEGLKNTVISFRDELHKNTART